MKSVEAVEKRDGRDVGRLLVIGGGEDRGDQDTWCILPRLVEMAGGEQACILVCGTSSAEPERVERLYKEPFEKLNARAVFESSMHDRMDGQSGDLLDQVEDATAVDGC